MKFLVVVLVALLGCAFGLDETLTKHWKLWKEQHGKKYFDAEEHVRRAVWEDNLKLVQTHNLQADLGQHTHWLKMNKFADMTNSEFVKQMNGYNMSLRTNQPADRHEFTRSLNVKLPDTVDWRDQGYVTDVKDQGQCGSCWAFSATGSLEGQHFKQAMKLTSLSEQNLVDCSGKYGNQGCNGGLMDQAFQYIKENMGIDTEDSYPYEARDDTCRFAKENVGATDTGFTDVTTKDESALQEAVATIGPISTINVIVELHLLDHGVLAIGYGTDSGTDYWLVKNSWGKGWGMDGYIKMTRNKRNQCGIATAASYPLV
ncbi:unnamed protein product [Didymodactylos carnosus]|uniref:Cathepsin L n=1 Tax=Didymodactylos carnosus TaxID=1234261 RepID=A0A814LIS4_9BILA|nr:unnamed protein product [Didymodactylos carnosus]CAF1064176.1 unnamed protein product [Didymodactylos carnosus]CAF3701204.1 unnamed protein product [Didymodactylos carnosus]CAF3832115.1 unnamed protein product [Didymodactylos carnosus]